jgi:hypothetical protein
VALKHSLYYRAAAKAHSLLMRQLMNIKLDAGFKDEDLHLHFYSETQRAAELKISPINPLPALKGKVKLLIVIPFRDKWSMTKVCLDGLLRQDRTGLEVLIALVDNGSIEAETFEGIKKSQKDFETAGVQIRHLRYEVPFNFSFLNNQAVKDCSDFRADVLALVNNDIEFLETDSVLQLVKGSFLPDAGAVGCTLLYPNRKIQHLFVFVGSKIVGSHPYKGQVLNLSSKWYAQPRAVGAVTGAVMFIQRHDYEKVGGFDEKLPTSYQDVDLCLKLQKIGLINWVLPKVMLIHHETQTRSHEPSWREAEYVEKKWGNFLFHNPFVSDVWSRKSEHFVFTSRAFLRLLLRKGA